MGRSMLCGREESLGQTVTVCAFQALLEEVYTTPKPGLVDLLDNGAHTDMDVPAFEKSAAAVAPYLGRMFLTGLSWQGSRESLFGRIREQGKYAERAMFAATGGVNTHKGAIFTMGILSAAAGVCLRQTGRVSAEMLPGIIREMTGKTLQAELLEMAVRKPKTHGEILYHRYGFTGIRGQAAEGFPVLFDTAYPMLEKYYGKQNALPIASENYRNRARINVLLGTISVLEDTNVLSRSDPQTLCLLQTESRKILDAGGAFSGRGMHAIQELNQTCIRKNISPGGAADMLAAALYLREMEELWGSPFRKNAN